MNDLEILTATFEKLNLEYEIERGTVKIREYDGEVEFDTMITIQNGIGYFAFYTEFYFLNDKFVGHGVWE